MLVEDTWTNFQMEQQQWISQQWKFQQWTLQ
jgi:hypothetical protein